ncbi:ZZ-type zinc finger-containing protein 3 [Caerostris darwini]|uniref:ZZ-type zinc finger-containing protein 3 n=1 Tax=Caerostris darwini TaxID=1538125 RepID=A0AAV4W8P2_9ARAC|nr:ZZ-type zinc finger-containing protein 3 [Caerostris darwini]
MDDIQIKSEPADFDSNLDIMPGTSNTSTEDSETHDSNILQAHEIKKENFETTQEMDSDSLDEFCFDSDHPALKNNQDYKELIKAIAVLEAQRTKTIQDIDCLYEMMDESLADPIKFVERLQRGEKIDFPKPINVYPVPVIDWSKYAINDNTSRRQQTRLSRRAALDPYKSGFKDKSCQSQEQKTNKPNQYWTVEEQKQLEELLVKFPPEEIESRRWVKIANCLENRTPVQVASRVQKYFIKLLKAGMPIPGRMPNLQYLKKPKRKNVIRNQASTFLVSQSLPVYMPEADDDICYNYHQPLTSEENSMESKAEMSDDEELNSELLDTPEYKELMLLRKLEKEKLQELEDGFFKCYRCKSESINYCCTECKPPMSVNFCENCANQ